MTETKDDLTSANQDTLTTYHYGTGNAGTQQTRKTVQLINGSTNPVIEDDTYSYNLQGRMSEVEVKKYDSTGTTLQEHTKSEYTYDANGMRVSQTVSTDGNKDGDFDDTIGSTPEDTVEQTKYLNDANNPTGYTQVLEERVAEAIARSYLLGLDVISQAIADGTVQYLLYDGHGSTRMLVDATGQPLSGQVFRYDAFGNRLDGNTALTNLLYSGERTDSTGLQYLRARYYDPNTGRFNRLDPWAGDLQSPQSLHKYLYCHGDGVNFIDPTGLFLEWAEVGKAAHHMISDLHQDAHGTGVLYGQGLPGWGNLILPDIVNYPEGQIGEIKPLSIGQIVLGKGQLKAALGIANGLSVTYKGVTVPISNPIPHGGPPGPWVPEDWQPGRRVLLLGLENPLLLNWVAVTLGNLDGVILYKAVKCPTPELAIAAAYVLADKIAQIASEMTSELQHGWTPEMGMAFDIQLEAAMVSAALTGALSWGVKTYTAIESLRLRVMTKIAGFNTFGICGLWAGGFS